MEKEMRAKTSGPSQLPKIPKVTPAPRAADKAPGSAAAKRGPSTKAAARKFSNKAESNNKMGDKPELADVKPTLDEKGNVVNDPAAAKPAAAKP